MSQSVPRSLVVGTDVGWRIMWTHRKKPRRKPEPGRRNLAFKNLNDEEKT